MAEVDKDLAISEALEALAGIDPKGALLLAAELARLEATVYLLTVAEAPAAPAGDWPPPDFETA